jgi:hypothetical protein
VPSDKKKKERVIYVLFNTFQLCSRKCAFQKRRLGNTVLSRDLTHNRHRTQLIFTCASRVSLKDLSYRLIADDQMCSCWAVKTQVSGHTPSLTQTQKLTTAVMPIRKGETWAANCDAHWTRTYVNHTEREALVTTGSRSAGPQVARLVPG